MKLGLFILLAIICLSSCKDEPIENQFPNLDFDYVVAYKMKGREEKVIEKNKLSINVSNENKKLDSTQVALLTNILNSKSTYGGISASCFEPHLGFVFYGSSNEILAHTTICLACNSLDSTPNIDEGPFSEKGAKRIFEFEKEIFKD